MIHLQGSLLCQHWLNNRIWELCCLGNIHLNEIRFMAPCSLCMCVCHIDPTTSVEIWKESPEGLVKEGDTVELRCQGDGNPPAPIIFNQEQVRIASFFSFIWTRFFWMWGCKPLRRSGHSRRLAQTMCFICSGWTVPYWFATLSMCLICICFNDNMTKGQQWFSNVSNGRPK